MPTINPEKLPKEKLQELRRYILMEFFMGALQACVDTLGPEDSTRMFEPYNKLSGHAIVINLEAENRFPRMSDDLLRAGVQFYYIMPLVWMSKISNGVLTANSFSAEVTRCLGQTLEQCGEGCNVAGQAQAETINPAFRFNCDMGLKRGHDRCRITVKRGAGSVGLAEEATACILPVRVTEEEVEFWPPHYFTGYWHYSNTNLVDALGEEKAKEILGPYMENVGATLALRLKKELEVQEDDARGLGAIMGFMNDMCLQVGEFTCFTADAVKKTIRHCPFIDPVMCFEFKRVAEGVCKTLNPDYAFKYESMISRGDDRCRWMITKK